MMSPVFSVFVFYLVLANCSLRITAFYSTCTNRLAKQQRLWGSSDKTSLEEIKRDIETKKSSEIKRMLVDNGQSTKGLFDKQDLIRALFEHEKQKLEKSTPMSVTFIPIKFPSSDTDYYGLELIVRGKTIRFMIDSGATISIVKKEVAAALNLPHVSIPPNAYTASMGGGKDMFTTKCTVEQAQLGKDGAMIPSSFELSVIANSQSLPPSCDGLLGLDFISSLGGAVRFDFQGNRMTFGRSIDEIIPSDLRQKFIPATINREYAGLALIDVLLDEYTSDASSSGRICRAMLDTGSLYSIANSAAVSPSTMASLPTSPKVCAGIDGRPMQMKCFELGRLAALGPAPVTGERRKAVSLASEKRTSIYAADVPGLQQVGLASDPVIIVGLDVLSKVDMVIEPTLSKMHFKTKS